MSHTPSHPRSIRELIEGFTPSSTTTRKPLGVPEGFSLPGPNKPAYELGGGRIGPVPHVSSTITAQYFEGDELKPGSFSVESRATLQRKLVNAGLLDPQAVNGVWGKASREAYRELLSIANASGLNEDQALAQFPLASQAAKEQQVRLNSIELSDPASLRKVLNETAREVLGRKATAKQEEMFIKAIQRLQTGAQTTKFEAEVAAARASEKMTEELSAGGTTEGDMTPDKVAEINKWVQQNFGVKSSGQWRSEAEDAIRRQKTGRKKQSDHVSGMAIDVSGPPEKLDAVAAWARAQPFVKKDGVLWRVKDHFDHVHISFKGKGTSSMPGSNIHTTSVQTMMPDPAAQAEETIRRENPVEAGAHDIATTFDTFQKIIGGKF